LDILTKKFPFRPTTTEVLIWRDTTSTGTFADAGGVIGKVLDYMGANPGYIPALCKHLMGLTNELFDVKGNGRVKKDLIV
jgi:hypothetical protein